MKIRHESKKNNIIRLNNSKNNTGKPTLSRMLVNEKRPLMVHKRQYPMNWQREEKRATSTKIQKRIDQSAGQKSAGKKEEVMLTKRHHQHKMTGGNDKTRKPNDQRTKEGDTGQNKQLPNTKAEQERPSHLTITAQKKGIPNKRKQLPNKKRRENRTKQNNYRTSKRPKTKKVIPNKRKQLPNNGKKKQKADEKGAQLPKD